MVTTTSMTPVSASTLSDQATANLPEVNQFASAETETLPSPPSPKNVIQANSAATPRKIVGISCELRSPIRRPNAPAMMKPSSGRKTMA